MDLHHISQSVFDRIMAFLTALFLPTNGYDAARARIAVLEALAEYDPRTNRELRLAALALAFSLGALDALSRAADEDLSLNQVLRLRSSANTLHRSARQAELALAEERTDPEEPAATAPEAAADTEQAPLPESTEPEDLARFARTSPPLSRQQRRKQARDAARRQQREQDLQARLAARSAYQGVRGQDVALTTPLPPPPILSSGLAGAGAHATSAVA